MMESFSDILSLTKSGEKSCSEILEEYIGIAENKQKDINSFISFSFERARKRAEELDSLTETERNTKALFGIPVAIKDNMLLKGEKTTCGSRILENYISPYTATAVDMLEKSGALIMGKTNMDEFAMGSSGETSHFGPTRNPADTSKIPGGSSSGSAAAVASGQVLASLGSDTGGSIRQPAAMCGIVGLKPSYGLVSRYGLVAFSSSLDQIGPFATCVDDAAAVLSAIAGFDHRDSTSIHSDIQDNDYSISSIDVSGMTIGIPSEYFAEGLSKEISDRIEYAVSELEKAGAEIREISLPYTKYAISVYYIIAPAEASANLARYDSVKYGYRTNEAEDLLQQYMLSRQKGFGDEVKRRIMIGTYALSSGYYEAYYLKAQKVRTLMKQNFNDVFTKDSVDLILTPSTPTTAFNLGEKVSDPLQMYLSDIYTISCNLVGIPGMSVPVGSDSNGLPIGLQLMGPYMSERKLLKAAKYLESLSYDKKI